MGSAHGWSDRISVQLQNHFGQLCPKMPCTPWSPEQSSQVRQPSLATFETSELQRPMPRKHPSWGPWRMPDSSSPLIASQKRIVLLAQGVELWRHLPIHFFHGGVAHKGPFLLGPVWLVSGPLNHSNGEWLKMQMTWEIFQTCRRSYPQELLGWSLSSGRVQRPHKIEGICKMHSPFGLYVQRLSCLARDSKRVYAGS